MQLSETTEFFSQVFTELPRRAAVYVPNVLTALVLIVAGWLVALLLRKIVYNLLNGALSWLSRHGTIARGVEKTTVSAKIPKFVSRMVYWGTLLFFLAAAIENLGLPGLSSFVQNLAYYLPTLLLGILIVVIGVVCGHVVRDWLGAGVSDSAAEYAPALARVAQASIVLVSIVVAADQVGVHSTFLMIALGIVMAAVLGAVAFAFATGAGPSVANIIASHYLQKTYHAGQRIRVQTDEGVIREITPTAVILETTDGMLMVPAKTFAEEKSLLVARGGDA
jgi:small-conductance mechanosensitive channel